MTPEILDEKMTLFLNELETDYEIAFEIRNINHAECYFKNNKATIFYDPKKTNIESIAHELLHVWLKKFNYSIGNHIYLCCASDPKLGKIFSKNLCDHIGNCFDHFKMYPKYLEMGYSPERFIANSLEEQCSVNDIEEMKFKKFLVYNSDSIDKFIGYLISIYADHMSRDYSIHIEKMKTINATLFNIVTKFWNEWTKFDIENVDPIFNSDTELVDNFISDVEDWTNRKILK